MEKEKNYLYKFCKIIYTVLLKIIFKPKVYGIDNIPKDGSLIFAGNHKHAVDPVEVMSSTKRIDHYMAKEELVKGIHGKLFEKIGLIKVYRGKSNPVAVMQAEKILQNGGTVGIFPEGTRNKTNEELLKFRHGTVLIAKRTNTKIVPFAIRGDYKIFKKGLEIEFAEPIDVSNIEIEEANTHLRNKVLELLRK